MTGAIHRRQWRSFGHLTLATDSDARLAQSLRGWLGTQGWQNSPHPDGSATFQLRELETDSWHCESELLGSFEGSRAWVLSELEFRCVQAALESSAHPAALHAALCGPSDSAILIIGAHASGKTTLSVALNAAGRPVSGDDVVFVAESGEVTALPRPLRLRGATIDLLDPQQRERATEDSIEGLLRIDPTSIGGAEAQVMSVGDVVFASYRPGAPTHWQRLGSPQAIPRAMHNTFDTKARTPETMGAVVNLFARARAWELDHGMDPGQAAQFLLGELSR